MIKIKKIPIKYTYQNNNIKYINNGNIKMEKDDYFFESILKGTNNIDGTYLTLNKAIEELNKNFN